MRVPAVRAWGDRLIEKLAGRIAHKDTGLPVKQYWQKGLWPALCPGLMTLLVVSAALVL